MYLPVKYKRNKYKFKFLLIDLSMTACVYNSGLLQYMHI